MDRQGVPVLDASAPLPDVIEAVRAAGCAVVENLVDVETMDAVGAEVEPWLAATPPGPDDFSGRNTRRTGSLIARVPSFRALAAHPTVTGVLDAVLGDHASNYQLHLTQIIAIGPGEPAQTVHRDQWAFDFFPFPSGFEVECHVMWAMTDFTEENGATRVMPGSHTFEDKLRFTSDDTVPAEMPKGSLLVYLGSLYHGGGANRSDAVRKGVNVGYALGWLRQEENQYLACPLDVARELDDDLLKLMGYRRAAYALGYFGDTRDPLEAVRGPAAAAAHGFAAH
jgi:ectoine hydroxylase-related dioxygenase (phytanoyl-CoA dioxygenase family)